jgi:hypothetical protein
MGSVRRGVGPLPPGSFPSSCLQRRGRGDQLRCLLRSSNRHGRLLELLPKRDCSDPPPVARFGTCPGAPNSAPCHLASSRIRLATIESTQMIFKLTNPLNWGIRCRSFRPSPRSQMVFTCNNNAAAIKNESPLRKGKGDSPVAWERELKPLRRQRMLISVGMFYDYVNGRLFSGKCQFQ